LLTTTVLFASGFFLPGFVTNSWSYLELSKTIFTDFYHVTTVRNFDISTPYSQAFPPLWPVVLGTVRRVMDLGVYTGFVLNYAICIGLLAALIRLFRRIDLPVWAGIACYLCALRTTGEPFSGGGIPLTLVLLTSTLVILFGESLNALRIALAGMLMGLACLTRFDAMAPACLIGVAFAAREYWTSREIWRAARVAAVYFVIFGATLSPMAVYGERHFGKLFPSDNTRIVMQARGGGVLEYYRTPPEPDLYRRPGQWISGLLLHKIPRVLGVGVRELVPEDQLSSILALGAAVLVVWGGAARRLRLSTRARWFTVFALMLIPVTVLPSLLGGIPDSRYYSAADLLFFGVLFVVLVSLIPDVWTPRRIRLMLVAAAVPLIPAILRPVWVYNTSNFSRTAVMAPLSPTPQMQRVTEAVHRDSGNQPHRLIFTDSTTAAAKYGALTGEPISLVPGLTTGTFVDFARDWHITHVYVGSIERTVWESRQSRNDFIMNDIRKSGVELVPLDLPGLYRVQLPSEKPRL
jgi:hypothetical protein